MDIRLAALFAQFSAPSGGCDALPVLGSPPLAFIMPDGWAATSQPVH
jgi:hypothetical protein